MITVGQILRQKGDRVWSISPEMNVFDGLKMMADKDVGALLVMDSGQVVGIMSERDFARRTVLMGRSLQDTMIRQIMTEDVVTVRFAQSIAECMALMTERHVRHLPVIDAGNVVGIVSIGDVVKAIISEQEETIRHLEKYIQGIP